MNDHKKDSAQRFSIGEWFGLLAYEAEPSQREALAQAALSKKGQSPSCPFLTGKRGGPTPCPKSGGVCSLRSFRDTGEEGVPAEGKGFSLRTLCPNRFEEDFIVTSWVGETLLGSSSCLVVDELPFLKGQGGVDEGADQEKKVGRIDRVLIHPDQSSLNWCALEMQAVYFSGRSFSSEFESLRTEPGKFPFPTEVRRPDYRSSGSKRLMPQLQIKVPTLRRWGRKMAVVVDEDFFGAMGRIESVDSVSNADIAWFLVKYEQAGSHAKLVPGRVVLTTLERAIEGLTAGSPLAKEEFEQEILAKLRRQQKPSGASAKKGRAK